LKDLPEMKKIEVAAPPRVLNVQSGSLDASAIEEAVKVLMQGGIIAYPTETVYGLGGDATNERVVERIRELKGREDRKPFLVLVGREEELRPYIAAVSQKARRLMSRFWPGPLTLVFRASSLLPESLTGKNNKVGVRVSSDSFCQRLLCAFTRPLISTSANPAGGRPAHSVSEIRSLFSKGVDLILDGGGRECGIPSTVVDVSLDPPVLLRRGAVAKEDIESVIGKMNEHTPS